MKKRKTLNKILIPKSDINIFGSARHAGMNIYQYGFCFRFGFWMYGNYKQDEDDEVSYYFMNRWGIGGTGFLIKQPA